MNYRTSGLCSFIFCNCKNGALKSPSQYFNPQQQVWVLSYSIWIWVQHSVLWHIVLLLIGVTKSKYQHIILLLLGVTKSQYQLLLIVELLGARFLVYPSHTPKSRIVLNYATWLMALRENDLTVGQTVSTDQYM